MPIGLSQILLAAILFAGILVVLYIDGINRWQRATSNRLLYGVPWGSLLIVIVVAGFYLIVQDGVSHWSNPVVTAFVSWSFFYPTGLFTAGIAHSGPDHLLSNLAATVVFAPLAEYLWGHFPDYDTDRRESTKPRWQSWIRAIVIFPVALFLVSVITSLFSLGPGLGFSGTVFALLGFVVVIRPLWGVIGVVTTSAVSVIFNALQEPVIRETVELSPPAPPSWASIGFYAHLLGFLLGVMVAVWLLSRRDEQLSFGRVAAGVFLVGAAQSLWLLVWTPSPDEFALYQGVGLIMTMVLGLTIAGAVAGSDRPLPRLFGRFRWIPPRRILAVVWLGLLVIVGGLAVIPILTIGESLAIELGTLALVIGVLAAPALPVIIPDRIIATPLSRSQTAIGVVVVVTFVIAAVGIPFGFSVVDTDSNPEEETLEIQDYSITYAENVPSDRTNLLFPDEVNATEEGGTISGIIVVSDEREIWTVPTDDRELAFEGEDKVVVGGVGWRETVAVDRVGWDVTGNKTAYAVDLTSPEGETTRSFISEPVEADITLDGQSIALVPTTDGFEITISVAGEQSESVPVPAVGESTSIGNLTISTQTDGNPFVVAESDDSRVRIAEAETFP